MLPNGITLVFSMLENKFNYNTPFAHRNLNVGIGYVCGLVQLLPFHRPWYFHLEHHNLAEYHADVDRHLDNALWSYTEYTRIYLRCGGKVQS